MRFIVMVKSTIESRSFSFSLPTLETRCMLLNILSTVIKYFLGSCNSIDGHLGKEVTKANDSHVLSSSFDILILARLILKVFAHTWTDTNLIVENDQKSIQFKTYVLDAFLCVESYYRQINSGNEKNDDFDCFFFKPFNAI